MMRKELARLAKSTIVYGVSQALSRSASILVLPLLTAFLTPADYGVASIATLVSFILVAIFSLGFGAAITPVYFESRDAIHRATTVWTAECILAIATAVMVGIGLLFSASLSEWILGSPIYTYAVILAILTAATTILSIPVSLFLQLEERAVASALLGVSGAVVAAVVAVVAVVALRRGFAGLLEATFVAQVFTLVVGLALASVRLKLVISVQAGRALLKTGLPLIPAFAFLFVIQQSSKFSLQWFHGLAAVGVFSVGVAFGTAMSVAITSFTTAWTPYFMSYVDRQHEASRVLGRILTYYVILFGGISLLFFVFARPVVFLMTQPAFHDAYAAVGFAALAQTLTGAFSVLLPAIYFARDVRLLALVQGTAAIASIGINLLLVPPFGLIGASVALALSALALPVVLLAWNYGHKHRYLEIEYEWRRVILCAAGYAVGAAALTWKPAGSLFEELVFSLVALGALLWISLRILTPVERQEIGAVLRRGRGPVAS